MKRTLVKISYSIIFIMLVVCYFPNNVSAKQYIENPPENDSVRSILTNTENIQVTDSNTKTNSDASVEICIPANTTINVALMNTISSKTAHKDDTISFMVTKVVNIDQVPVISVGTTVLGKVIKAKSASIFGQDGELIFSIDSVKTIHDITVPLSYTATYTSSDQSSALKNFLKKGKDVSCDAGTPYVATVTKDVDLGITKANLLVEIAAQKNKK
jgi:hypothetical protein